MVRIAVDKFLSGTDLYRLQLEQSMAGGRLGVAAPRPSRIAAAMPSRCCCTSPALHCAATRVRICILSSGKTVPSLLSVGSNMILVYLDICLLDTAGRQEGDPDAMGESPAVRMLQQNTRLGECWCRWVGLRPAPTALAFLM